MQSNFQSVNNPILFIIILFFSLIIYGFGLNGIILIKKIIIEKSLFVTPLVQSCVRIHGVTDPQKARQT